MKGGNSVDALLLKTNRDLERAPRDLILESESLSLLAGACSRGRFVMPLRAKGFFRDDALLAAAEGGGGVFVIPLSALVKSWGSGRQRLLRELRFFLRLCVKRNAKFVLTNDLAESKFDLKGAREAEAIGVLLGLTSLQARAAFVNSASELPVLAAGGRRVSPVSGKSRVL